jgi:lipid II:glycine glycyltransferase (peptidoglycan interpeptide bridge formation enzyme)
MIKATVHRVGLDQLDASSNPFQSQFWALAKRPTGWRSFAFRYVIEDEQGGEISTVFLVLVRRLFLHYRLAYIPFAPDIHQYSGETSVLIDRCAELLRPLLPKGTAFVRFDLPWQYRELEIPENLSGRYIRVCHDSVQPEGTVRINLDGGYEQVRLQYRERARRNIRKARAQGIIIRPWDTKEQTFSDWYSVYMQTAKRDGFVPRPSSYLYHLLTLQAPDVSAYLYVAYLGNTILGGALIIESKETAIYLYGASIRVDGCSPSYMLQDYAIAQACNRGRILYDLYGISGPGNRCSHLDGLRLFKRAFGGEIWYRSPSVDRIYRRFIRWSYAHLEMIRYVAYRKKHPKKMIQQYSVGKDT